MTDRSKLKLHPGSRWDGDAVVDTTGCSISLNLNGRDKAPYLSISEKNGEVAFPWITDLLAVIRAAGLDPEFEELEEARTEIARLTLNAQMDAQIIQAVRETCHNFEDRLEAANKRIAELESDLEISRSNECRCW